MARTSCIWWDDFRFVLDHLNTLSWKFIVLDMSIFSLSLLVLHAYGRSIKYKILFLSLWFDTTRDWKHHLPHLRQPRYPLHHLCGSVSVETCFDCCSSSFSLRTNILFGFSSAMWFIIVQWLWLRFYIVQQGWWTLVNR